VVEVDGSIHEIKDQKEYDEDRTADLNQFGIKVIRFTNREVESDIAMVLKKIEEALVPG
jgi:very-short-patch-repair endonuclease